MRDIRRIRAHILILMSLCFAFSFGCSTTQKTGGEGMVSVIAHNVVRIAGIKAMQTVDLSSVKGKATFVKLTGFVDDRNRSFLENLVRSKSEEAGARLVSEDKAALTIEVVVNSAGNDRGASAVPLITSAERTEGTVNIDLIIRSTSDGTKISTQNAFGQAEYEQRSVLGVSGSGTYYVKDAAGAFKEVPNPALYK